MIGLGNMSSLNEMSLATTEDSQLYAFCCLFCPLPGELLVIELLLSWVVLSENLENGFFVCQYWLFDLELTSLMLL